MITYKLKCNNDHRFEGWFKNSTAFDSQRDSKQVECPACGSFEVEKSLSAPNISTSRKQASAQAEFVIQAQQTIQKLRKTVESNCDNVGENFAEEARKIHYGEAEERGIYGKATADETKELAEEGVKFLPLPWMEKESKN